MNRKFLSAAISLVLVIAIAVVPSCKAGSPASSSVSETPTHFAYMSDETWASVSANMKPSSFASKADFLAEAEKNIKDISDFIGKPDWYKDYLKMQADDGETYYIQFLFTDGNSNAFGVQTIGLNQSAFETGTVAVAHEITHVVFRNYNSSSLSEGFACYCQEKFGKSPDYPGMGVGAHVYANLIYTMNSDGFEQLLPDIGLGVIREDNYGTLQSAFYAYSYSFVTYLIDAYGIEKFVQLYQSTNLQDDYLNIYGKSIDDIKTAWRDTVVNYPEPITGPEYQKHCQEVLAPYGYSSSSSQS